MSIDIKNKQDIKLLVDSFYDKVKTDDLIGYLFIDIAKINWEKHLPTMYDFWANALLYDGSYEGNPMLIHQHLNKLMPLKVEHFERWNELFINTIDELFKGRKATFAKQKALSISAILQLNILQQPLPNL